MTELTLRGQPIHTVFDLLGKKENDITYAVGWALAQSERLVRALLDDLSPTVDPGALSAVRLQEFVTGSGITDIEVVSDALHLIIEAKRGWSLPSEAQLAQYAPRLDARKGHALCVMAECSPEFAKQHLPDEVAGVEVLYRSWKQLTQLVTATATHGGHAEKRLLRELVRYLRGLMTMQNTTSNLVYVVSLGSTPLDWSDLNFIETVEQRERYYHPVGGGKGGWPKEPPNYLGFRYWGRLQSVRHVEDYEVIEHPHDYIPEIKPWVDWSGEPHFLYTLGPPIVPGEEVKTGKLYRSQRVWVALDLLLTSSTIAEARDKTNERLAKAGA